MKVVAIKRGFYEQIRKEGDAFEVEDGLTASWFEPVAKENQQEQIQKPTGGKYDNMTKEELQALLDERGIDYHGNTGEATLIALLESSDEA
nr:MAG TPA: dimeris T4 recombination endonuclease VII [Caudoviricetes sp.]